MNMKLVSMTVMACCLAGGSAFARSGALDEKADMLPFYQDSEMKQMKTGDEFKTVVNSLSTEKLKDLSDSCHEDANGQHKHKDFCAALDQASGVKSGAPDTGSPSESDSNSN